MRPLRELMRDKRVAGALAALAVAVVAFRIFTGSPGTTAPTAVAPPAPETPPPSAAAPGGEVPEAPREAAASESSPAGPGKEIAWSWSRNPFLPRWGEPRTGAGGGGETDPAAARDLPSGLRGTVVSGTSGIAIFGSRLVPAGGRIGSWTVERVEPYAVTLRSGNETRVVEIFKPPPPGGGGRGGER